MQSQKFGIRLMFRLKADNIHRKQTSFNEIDHLLHIQ